MEPSHYIVANDVQKILEAKTEVIENREICFYKILWKPTWVAEDSLMKSCGDLIKSFWEEKRTNHIDDSLNLSKETSTDYLQSASIITSTVKPLKVFDVSSHLYDPTGKAALPSLFTSSNTEILPFTIPAVSEVNTPVTHVTNANTIAFTDGQMNPVNDSNLRSSSSFMSGQLLHATPKKSQLFEPLSSSANDQSTFLHKEKGVSARTTESNNSMARQSETLIGEENRKNMKISEERYNQPESMLTKPVVTQFSHRKLASKIIDPVLQVTSVLPPLKEIDAVQAIPNTLHESSQRNTIEVITSDLPALQQIDTLIIPNTSQPSNSDCDKPFVDVNKSKNSARKRGRKKQPKKAETITVISEQIDVFAEAKNENSDSEFPFSEGEIYDDNDDDSDYIPDEDDEVTRTDMEVDESGDKPVKKKKARAKSNTTPKPRKRKKENNSESLTKCSECGKEHNKEMCPRCMKRKTCDACGHKYVNKCTKCAYTCSLCGKICWKSYRLKQHIETIHEKIKKYKCDTCGLLFVAQSRLLRHRDVHKAAPDLVCKVCSKAFRHRTTFYRHRKIHTGIKPYKCPICNRDFQQKEALKTHMRIHSTGPKRFKCLLCEKDFNHKVSLKEHMSKHHNKDEQQAAVMIGLWKKYQMEEGLSIESPNSEVLLSRALNAVAMKPMDSTTTTTNSTQSGPTAAASSSNSTQLHAPNQPHISLVDFPYIDFLNQEVQLPLPNYENREVPLHTNSQNRDVTLISTQPREVVMVTNSGRELGLGVTTTPRELFLPLANYMRPISLINHPPTQEINMTSHLENR